MHVPPCQPPPKTHAHSSSARRLPQVTVPQLPPQAPPLPAPPSAPQSAPSGREQGQIVGKDLSGRALRVLQNAASLHSSAAAQDAAGSSTASRLAALRQAVERAQSDAHSGGDRGRWLARGRSAPSGGHQGHKQGQGNGQTYAQQLLASEVARFESQTRKAIAAASRADALRRRRLAAHRPLQPASPPLPGTARRSRRVRMRGCGCGRRCGCECIPHASDFVAGCCQS